MAYGTETVPRVDKIVGPGNIYVATAKRLLYGVVDIDMIAGPSEILIVADDTANPRYLAADMMSQAEHDVLASSVLLTTSRPGGGRDGGRAGAAAAYSVPGGDHPVSLWRTMVPSSAAPLMREWWSWPMSWRRSTWK